MTFIGIDYSINSTAVCIYKEGEEEKFFNFQRAHIAKKYMKEFEESSIDFTFLDKIPTDLSYVEVENLKIKEAKKVASLIITLLSKYGIEDDLYLGIEGFSYGSAGKRALDLAGFQYILRSRLEESGFIKNWFVFTPGEVKKFAIKGNASKELMMQTYLEVEADNELTRVMTTGDIASRNPKFTKPIDDLVDSYFIAHYTKKIIDEKLF